MTTNDQQDLKKYAEDLGKKIGFLIAGLNIQSEAREEFMNVIEDFSLDQMEGLAGILESRLSIDAAGNIEEDLRIKLEKISINYLEGSKKLNQETVEEIRSLL